jgi:phage shock protein A
MDDVTTQHLESTPRVDVTGVLTRTEEHVDAIRAAASDLAAVLPTRVEAAIARALESTDGTPLPRQVAEVQRSVTAIADAVRVVSRDLASERLGRVGDLEVLVDLVASSAETTRADVQRLDRRVSRLEATIGELQAALDRLAPIVATVSEKLDRRVRISVQTDPAVAVFGDGAAVPGDDR